VVLHVFERPAETPGGVSDDQAVTFPAVRPAPEGGLDAAPEASEAPPGGENPSVKGRLLATTTATPSDAVARKVTGAARRIAGGLRQVG
jgi:hypothetical protein